MIVHPRRVADSLANGRQFGPGEIPHFDPDPRADDRCDGCGHEAQVLWERDADTLALCGHHHQAAWIKLHEAGWEIAADRRTVSPASGR